VVAKQKAVAKKATNELKCYEKAAAAARTPNEG